MHKSKLLQREARTSCFYIAPSFILLLLFSIIPIFASFALSFTDYTVLGSPQFCGVANYLRFFKDTTVKQALLNSVIYTIVTVPLQTIFALVIAAVIAEHFRNRFGNIIKGTLFIPSVASAAVCGTVWCMILSPTGLINSVLASVFDNTVNFLGSKSLSIFVICFVLVWKNVGYFLVIYYAGIMDIPHSLYEAAEVDGATPIQRFFHITLPNLKSISYLVVTLGTIWAFQSFDIVKVMTDGGPGISTISLVLTVYRAAFKEYRMGYACAVSVLLLIVIIVISLLQKAVVKRGED